MSKTSLSFLRLIISSIFFQRDPEGTNEVFGKKLGWDEAMRVDSRDRICALIGDIRALSAFTKRRLCKYRAISIRSVFMDYFLLTFPL